MRNSIKAALRQIVQIAGTAAVGPIGLAASAPPIERLTAHFQRNAELAEELAGPSTGRNDQPITGVGTLIGFDGDSGPFRAPAADFLANAQLGAQPRGLFRMRLHAPLDQQVSGPPLEDRFAGTRDTKPLEACFGIAGRKILDFQAVQLGAGAHASEDFALRWPDLQQPHLVIERLAAALLQLVPQLECSQHQRHVVGVLVIGLADQPGLAVRAAAIVSWRKAIEPKHACSPGGQVKQRRAADTAYSQHNRVIAGHDAFKAPTAQGGELADTNPNAAIPTASAASQKWLAKIRRRHPSPAPAAIRPAACRRRSPVRARRIFRRPLARRSRC